MRSYPRPDDSAVSRVDTETRSWLESYPPTTVVELAVNPIKVKAIRKWIVDALAGLVRPTVLILCGCSGCGKSTTIDLVCKELGVEILEWSDDMLDSEATLGKATQQGSLSITGELENFARQSSFPTLSLEINDGNKMPSNHPKKKMGAENPPLLPGAKIMLMHSPPFRNGKQDDLENFSDLMMLFTVPVVLILSDVGGADDMAFSAERALGLKFLQKNRLSHQVMYCNPITVKKTEKALRRVISCAQRYNKIASNADRNIGQKSLTLCTPSDKEIEEIAQSSLGDIRHAVIQLQMLSIYKSQYLSVGGLKPSGHGAEGPKSQSKGLTQRTRQRDVSFSSLHGVGKLLRASQDSSGRFDENLDFVLESSEFPIDISLAFMQFHCIDSLHRSSQGSSCLADIALLEDISLALNCFAEAGMFWDKQFALNSNLLEHQSGILAKSDSFPVSYAVCISSRAVGIARGVHGRSWEQNSLSQQAWEALPVPLPLSDELIDLSSDEVATKFDNTREIMRERSTHTRKRARILDDDSNDQVPSGRSGGFLKLTRPKVLDLWRSNKYSAEQVLSLRDELINMNMDVARPLIIFQQCESATAKNWLSTRELYVTVIPLFRIILERSGTSQVSEISEQCGDVPLVRHFSSRHLLRKIASIFPLKSHDKIRQLECDEANYYVGKTKSAEHSTITVEDEIMMLDDIEEF